MSDLSNNEGPGWHAASEAEINKITRGSRPLIIAVALCILTFILWAGWCELDEITRGEGKVIPSSQVQNVQNMEGGIVDEILVSEGELVEQGQVLMVMDDTRFTSTRQGQLANRNALMARKARLMAEVEGGEPIMPDSLTSQVPVLADREIELFHNRQLELNSSVGVYQQQLAQQKKQVLETKAQREMLTRRFALLDEELQLARDLAAEGAVSRVEVLRLERQVSDTQGEKLIAEKNLERIAAQQEETQQRINETRLNFVNKARVELNETLAQLHELTAKETAVSDQVERTRVRAPMKGVVKQILVNTEGGVVQPGMVMMELIPVDDTLEVEARIPATGYCIPSPWAESHRSIYRL